MERRHCAVITAYRVTNDNLRYWKFKNTNDSGPRYLNEKDFSDIEESNSIFARKVKYNSGIMRLLESVVNN